MRPAWLAPAAASALTLALAIVLSAAPAGQASQAYVGVLDEHPAIQYAMREPTDRVARLNRSLVDGSVTLERDPASGYLRSLLSALDVPLESQLLVFSKTGIQRNYTSPQNPRALYYDQSVVVGYIAGAPVLEIASHDRQQGVVFYTLDQSGPSPALARRTVCLTCHVSASTLDVPGMIDRSNVVGVDGGLLPQLGSFTVNHQTPHTQRWGGWYVNGNTFGAPYQPLGHLGNLTTSILPGSGPAIVSDRVAVDWMNSAPESRGYPSTASDLAALLVFDHQAHAINLLTRLNWDVRVAQSRGPLDVAAGALRERVDEVVDYLLFVGEVPPVVAVTPRKGFAEQLALRVPKDRRGRSFGELDLETRLLRYPCSYMIYTEAFDGLPGVVKEAVYRRMFTILSGADASPKYRQLSADDRRAILEILRDTRDDLPADLRS